MNGREMLEDKGRLGRARAHTAELRDRQSAAFTGVADVEAFNEEEVVLLTDLGVLVLGGEGLHIGRLSLETGELSAEGALSGLQYEDAPPGQGGFWARLFG